jgi:hypothetical protein
MKPRFSRTALLFLLCVGPTALAQPYEGQFGVCDLEPGCTILDQHLYDRGIDIVENGARNKSIIIYCNHGLPNGRFQGDGPGLPLLDGRKGEVRFYAACYAGSSGRIESEANRTGLPCVGPNGEMNPYTGQVRQKRL